MGATRADADRVVYLTRAGRRVDHLARLLEARHARVADARARGRLVERSLHDRADLREQVADELWMCQRRFYCGDSYC